METKTLLAGIIGFMLGGLLVSTAASTINKPEPASNHTSNHTSSHSDMMTMAEMAASLQGKTGDDYDKAFLAEMIEHHQGAVDMAKQSAATAKHDELKQLSAEILKAQEEEIHKMEHWQVDWGYVTEGHGSDNNPTTH